MSVVRTFAALGFGLAAFSCAFEAGGGFARLEPGTLQVELEIGSARELAPGRLLTDLGYQVELAECRLALRSFELQVLQSAGGGGEARFDPGNPPAGYSLCHAGHCHAEDGSTPSYEEIQARLAGGRADWQPVARVDLASEVDVLARTRRRLSDYEPTPELPRCVIGRAALEWSALRCNGRVEGGALASPVALELDLPLENEPLHAVLDQAITRDGPAALSPEVRIEIDGSLFDGLDFASLAIEARVRLEAASGAARELATESLRRATALAVRFNVGKE